MKELTKQKTIIRIAAGVLCLLLLAGCTAGSSGTAASGQQTADTTASENLLEAIRERGTIIVAMEGTWAPWTYHDEADNLVGYDVEVAQKIAEKLGVTAEFVEGEWDGLLAGLEAGRYDIMVNGVDVT
ncbi:MAG: transporter substrate-binding domain-containing protein, partial [Lachnospiraceae bacterium]|nr:transporter substrate-binding domain-containing protein [Lachnospiraceae bacterium]